MFGASRSRYSNAHAAHASATINTTRCAGSKSTVSFSSRWPIETTCQKCIILPAIGGLPKAFNGLDQIATGYPIKPKRRGFIFQFLWRWRLYLKSVFDGRVATFAGRMSSTSTALASNYQVLEEFGAWLAMRRAEMRESADDIRGLYRMIGPRFAVMAAGRSCRKPKSGPDRSPSAANSELLKIAIEAALGQKWPQMQGGGPEATQWKESLRSDNAADGPFPGLPFGTLPSDSAALLFLLNDSFDLSRFVVTPSGRVTGQRRGLNSCF